jgi:GNAT superfamily N-acetyltransferase
LQRFLQTSGEGGGIIIGSSSGREYGIPENAGWIDTIGVLPEYQNKGIARLLLKEMVAIKRDHLHHGQLENMGLSPVLRQDGFRPGRHNQPRVEDKVRGGARPFFLHIRHEQPRYAATRH